jgi:hypothetical protein
MTRTEDMLRSALASATTPPTNIADPLADLDRRVSRARTRRSIAAAVGVFVIAAAVVVPLTLIGRGDSGSPTAAQPGHHSTSATWVTAHVLAVAEGGGSVWSLEEHAAARVDHIAVVQRDPVSGVVVKKWHVGTNNDFIAYAYNRVWVWGGGDSAAPMSTAMTLDPTTGVRSLTAHLGRGNALSSVAFVNGHAWGAVPERQRAVRFSFDSKGHSSGVLKQHVARLTVVVALGPTTLGLVTTTGQIESVQASGTRMYQVPAGTRPWVPAAGAASGHVFWVSHGASVYREDVTTARRIGSSVSLPDAPFDVVADGSGGIYVERANPNDLPTVKSLWYYSATSLASASPRPTAQRAAGEVESLAVDPAGGVVYTDSSDALIHWDPAGAALR